jgi:hydrogenase expression/formation protein HypC
MRMAKVDFGGVLRETCLEALPEAKLGDYVIVHAGFALNTLSEKEALETLEIFREMDALADAESELNELSS